VCFLEDGAFVVRRSSQGATEHPYTLMLLRGGRVYNVMVRRQGGRFSLGAGIKRTTVDWTNADAVH